MNALKKIQNRINERIPDVSMVYDPSEIKGGSSWLDVESNDQHITIEWKPDFGFGLYLDNDNSFGSGPNEIYRKEEALLKRVSMLLIEKRLAVKMKEIRELLGCTQENLSHLMGQRQSSISKFENREDMQLSSIENFVKALGGTLEIKAHFEDFDLQINLPKNKVAS